MIRITGDFPWSGLKETGGCLQEDASMLACVYTGGQPGRTMVAEVLLDTAEGEQTLLVPKDFFEITTPLEELARAAK